MQKSVFVLELQITTWCSPQRSKAMEDKEKKDVIDVKPEEEEESDSSAEKDNSGAENDTENGAEDDTENTDDQDKKGHGGAQLKEILDGTARIGQSIGQAFVGMAEIFKGRDYVVMVRVNKDSLDKIDELIESGMFKSRSESAAYLIARGIQSDNELFHKIEDKVSEINRLKEELRSMLDFDK